MKLKGRDSVSAPRYYFERVNSFNPDVLIVVCSQTWTLDWLIPCLDHIQCVKIFYSHGYSRLWQNNLMLEKLKKRNVLGAFEEWKVYRYYKRLHRIISEFDLAIYLSELNNSYLYAEENGLSNGKVLENAIEDIFVSEKMRHSQDSFQRPDIRYLYVANYSDNKNQDMLLKAFCEAEIENAVLQFVGFEENDYLVMLREHLKQWMTEQGTKRVVFHVHLSREQIYELYRTSDVFVCTSRTENCPIVHCEAAATGMAIISTNVGDVSLKDGILLIENEQQLCEAIERLYNNRDEISVRGEKLRKYMLGRNCRVTDKVDWLESELKDQLRNKENTVTRRKT